MEVLNALLLAYLRIHELKFESLQFGVGFSQQLGSILQTVHHALGGVLNLPPGHRAVSVGRSEVSVRPVGRSKVSARSEVSARSVGKSEGSVRSESRS